MWWLLAFVLFLVIEIGTVSLASIWFAVGSLIAFVVSMICDVLWIQILVFLLVSLVLLVATRPIAERFLNKNREKTNVDAMVGRQGIVTAEINNLKAVGEVTLSGQVWTARSKSEQPIPEGVTVVVREIQGVKLIVEEYKEDMK